MKPRFLLLSIQLILWKEQLITKMLKNLLNKIFEILRIYTLFMIQTLPGIRFWKKNNLILLFILRLQPRPICKKLQNHLKNVIEKRPPDPSQTLKRNNHLLTDPAFATPKTLPATIKPPAEPINRRDENLVELLYGKNSIWITTVIFV